LLFIMYAFSKLQFLLIAIWLFEITQPLTARLFEGLIFPHDLISRLSYVCTCSF
jgi:hypothetical protein